MYNSNGRSIAVKHVCEHFWDFIFFLCAHQTPWNRQFPISRCLNLGLEYFKTHKILVYACFTLFRSWSMVWTSNFKCWSFHLDWCFGIKVALFSSPLTRTRARAHTHCVQHFQYWCTCLGHFSWLSWLSVLHTHDHTECSPTSSRTAHLLGALSFLSLLGY